MKAQIPEIIEIYFRASNANDVETLVSCFSTDAIVIGEDETHRGTAAIKGWSVNVRKKYEFKAEVLRAIEKPGAVVVTAKLSGTFPGSPVDLDFKFTLKGKQISSLEIG
ncbi:MAG TPA: nuclear transport factor 2 family protein [Verrucomicrobiae bacterium]|nr:nuclear transport factor 2 family protein [Verrucomicrobiae bacterium]